MNKKNHKQLIKKLDRLHGEEKFFEIIEIILEISEKDRDYDIISQLSRAYNNADHFIDAIEQLLLIKDQGQNDSLWHFRMGYAYFYLEKYENALKEFELSYELHDKDDEVKSDAKLLIEVSKANISHESIFIDTFLS